MSDDNEGNIELVCEFCESPVKQEDDFCPECGTLFIEDVYCENHPKIPANGVCIICGVPYCTECGFRVSKLFLCSLHSDYEIYEGMAKVFGTPEESSAEFIKSLLIQGGLHPVLLSREGPYGSSRYMFSTSRTEGDHIGSLFNEVKVLVPCLEVILAEGLLKEQKLI